MMKIKLTSGLLFLFSLFAIIPASGQQHASNIALAKELSLTQQKIIVLNNQQKMLPVTRLGGYNIASVCFGIRFQTAFDSLVNKYEKVNSFTAYDHNPADTLNDLNDRLKLQHLVILVFSENTDFNPDLINFIRELGKSKGLMIVF